MTLLPNNFSDTNKVLLAYGCEIRCLTTEQPINHLVWNSFRQTGRFRILGCLRKDGQLVDFCVIDTVYQTVRFVMADDSRLSFAQNYLFQWCVEKFPFISKKTFVVHTAQYNPVDSVCHINRWFHFIANIVFKALRLESELGNVLNQLQATHLRSNYIGYLNRLNQYPYQYNNVNLYRNACLQKENSMRRREWSAYLVDFFNLEVEQCDDSWGVSKPDYEEAVRVMGHSFGSFIEPLNFAVYFKMIQLYFPLQPKEFVAEFKHHSDELITIEFTEQHSPAVFHRLIQVATVVATLAFAHRPIFDSLLSDEFALSCKNDPHLAGFSENPNIFKYVLPYKVILPFYWYLSRELSLPTYTPQCPTIFDKNQD